MSELKRNQIGFLVTLINEFARRFSLTDKQSFEYIYRNGGIEMYLYTSPIYDALRNPDSRLYFQSPGYVYSCINQTNEIGNMVK